jgi:carnitine 3-dehydrogenase
MGVMAAPSRDLRPVAVLGGGVIGAGWVARLIENGLDVAVFDPAPDAEAKLAAALANADAAYAKLFTAPRRAKGRLRRAASVGEACAGAGLIVEAVPERLELKHRVYAEAETTAAADALIASSTSGLKPSDLQAPLYHPERLLVAHPFNPVYLLPVVEIVAGRQTAEAAVARAMAFYPTLGMKPVRIRQEIEAFVGDRLLEALWREALWLIRDGICTTAELDDIVRYGFGLRWAQLGVFDTYRVAGGEAGMRHFMAQFGPCLRWPWTRLTEVPEFDDALVELIAGQSDAQSGHIPIRELERIRDDNLVAIQKALQATHWGAGALLAQHEAALAAEAPEPDWSAPLPSFAIRVPAHWLDYNGHMTESRYLEAFAFATDGVMRMVGLDAEAVAAGHSLFTAETHLRHLGEVGRDEEIAVTTQLLAAEGRKMHLWHEMRQGDRLVATAEHLLIHIDLGARRAADPPPAIRARIDRLAAHHARLPAPAGVGRRVGQPKE